MGWPAIPRGVAHLGHIHQALARAKGKKMIAKGSRPGVEPNGLKPVVLRVLHVQPAVTGGTLDQRCRVQDAEASLAQ